MTNLFYLCLLLFHALVAAGCSAHDGGQKTVLVEAGHPAKPENGRYLIERKWVRLADSEPQTTVISGTTPRTSTKVFGQPVYGELDGNSDVDAALMLVQQRGGSGTFFYVAAALNAGGSYQGTNAVFLGDRILPEKIEIRTGHIIVFYKDRRPDEPMVAPPLVSKTKRLCIKDGRLEIFEP